MTEAAARPRRRWGRQARPVLVGLGLVALGLGAWLVATVALDRPPARPPLPAHNGYDDLLAAARQVARDVPGGVDLARVPVEQARPLVEADREVLGRAREALGRESRVPVRFEPAEIEAALGRAQALRGLARLMDAASRLEEQDGRIAEAVALALDLVRLGQAAGRGGLLVEAQVGLAIEGSHGYRRLEALADRVPTGALPEVIRALERADAEAEPFETIRGRELAFAKTAHGWQTRVAMALSPAILRQVESSLRLAETGHRRVQARRRLLLTRLAIRLYRERHGAGPRRLEDLAPEILSAVPRDPFGDGPLVYRPDGDGPRLYSVGPDGDDDGGRPVPNASPGADGDIRPGP